MKAGQALIWAANLLHGGKKIMDKKKTLKYLKKHKKVLLSVDIDYSTKNNFTINYE